jgi:hypothetical protein
VRRQEECTTQSKDGDAQDALGYVGNEARERGIILDDSPENNKVPVSKHSVCSNIDPYQIWEIQSDIILLCKMKAECWEPVGMSKQRMGSVSALKLQQVPIPLYATVLLSNRAFIYST